MTLSEFIKQVEAVVRRRDFGKPSAAKRGRPLARSHVPIIEHTQKAPPFNIGRRHTEQIQGRAFAKRDDAVNYAQRVIDARRVDLLSKLVAPGGRALREYHGLPTEVPEENQNVHS